jgi:hypothetical protein
MPPVLRAGRRRVIDLMVLHSRRRPSARRTPHQFRRRRVTCGATEDAREERVFESGAYSGQRRAHAGNRAPNRRVAEPAVDGFRGRRVRRLPRRNGAPGVLAGAADVTAVRSTRAPLSPVGCPRLDQPRRTDTGLVNHPQRRRHEAPAARARRRREAPRQRRRRARASGGGAPRAVREEDR